MVQPIATEAPKPIITVVEPIVTESYLPVTTFSQLKLTVSPLQVTTVYQPMLTEDASPIFTEDTSLIKKHPNNGLSVDLIYSNVTCFLNCSKTNRKFIYVLFNNFLNYLPAKLYQLLTHSYEAFLIVLLIVILFVLTLFTFIIILLCKRHSASTCLYERYVESHLIANNNDNLNSTFITKINSLVNMSNPVENTKIENSQQKLMDISILTEDENAIAGGKLDCNKEMENSKKKKFNGNNYFKKSSCFSKLTIFKKRQKSNENDPIVENTHL